MNILKPLAVKSLAVALALSLAPATLPTGPSLFGTGQAEAAQLFGGTVQQAQWHHRGWRGGRHRRWYRHGHNRWRGGHRYYRHHRHHGIGSGGAAVLGGIIGLGVGAALAAPHQRYERYPRAYGAPRFRSRAWYRYCENKYRSFDPRSGTYQPYHGPRRLCR